MSRDQTPSTSRSYSSKSGRSAASTSSWHSHHSEAPQAPSSRPGSSSPYVSISSESDISPAHEEVYRIQSCLDYVRECHEQGRQPQSMIRFTIPRSLDILRQAVHNGEAVSISRDVDTETFELGIRPIPQPYPSGIAPTWFYGLNPPEVRAGPGASQQEIKRAQTTLKGINTRRNTAINKDGDAKTGRTRKEEEIQDKLEEGVRRQQAEEKQQDSDSSSTSEDSSDESEDEDIPQAQSSDSQDDSEYEEDEDNNKHKDQSESEDAYTDEEEEESSDTDDAPPRKAAAATSRAGRPTQNSKKKFVVISSSDSDSSESEKAPRTRANQAKQAKPAAPVTRKRQIVESDSEDQPPVNKRRKVAPAVKQAANTGTGTTATASRGASSRGRGCGGARGGAFAAPAPAPAAAPNTGRSTRSGREY